MKAIRESSAIREGLKCLKGEGRKVEKGNLKEWERMENVENPRKTYFYLFVGIFGVFLIKYLGFWSK